MTASADPGVPEAIPRALLLLRDRLGATAVDRLWIFPPLVRGRKEWGLIAASCFAEDGRRRLVTARYVAERTGRGLTFEPDVNEEGLAPQDRFPRMIGGVVERAENELGDPREVEVGGDPDRFDDLMDEFDPSLLEAT